MCFFSFIFKTINVNVDYCAIQINWPFRGCFSTVWLWCKNTIKNGNKQVFFSRFEFSWYLTNYIQNKHAIFQSINFKFVSNWNQLRLFKSGNHQTDESEQVMEYWWTSFQHEWIFGVRIPCSNYLYLFWLLVIKVYLIFPCSLVHVRRSVILYDFQRERSSIKKYCFLSRWMTDCRICNKI